MQVSYNKLKTFEECALKYRLAYVEKQPRPPIAWLAFQRKVHAALAKYHTLARADGTVNIDELLREYDVIWDAGKHPEVRDGVEYQEGEEILRLYADLERRRNRVPAYLEQKISDPFGPYVLTGKIDRVDFAADGYSIIDYKLDRKLPPANPAAVSDQLNFYQLLLYEGLGHFADDVRLLYLRHGVEKIAPRSKESMRQTVDWIDKTASAIREERKWSPCEGDGCKACAFWKMCPAKTGRSREPVAVWQQATLPW
jgi:DNA helicase-2/ATP-dependent DNA helicase PcrA